MAELIRRSFAPEKTYAPHINTFYNKLDERFFKKKIIICGLSICDGKPSPKIRHRSQDIRSNKINNKIIINF